MDPAARSDSHSYVFMVFIDSFIEPIVLFRFSGSLLSPPSEALTCESSRRNTADQVLESAAGLLRYIVDHSVYAAHADDFIPANIVAFPPVNFSR